MKATRGLVQGAEPSIIGNQIGVLRASAHQCRDISFDLYDDIIAIDEEGQELPNLQAAQLQALNEARQVISGTLLESGKIELRHQIRVRDEGGAPAHLVEFEDAVSVRRGGVPV